MTKYGTRVHVQPERLLFAAKPVSKRLDFVAVNYFLPSTQTIMSDREGGSGLPPIDDELSLPKATVAKMISGSFI